MEKTHKKPRLLLEAETIEKIIGYDNILLADKKHYWREYLYGKRDLETLHRLAILYIGLAEWVAESIFKATQDERRDLVQFGYTILLKAIEKYKPSKGVFVTYATTSLRNALKRVAPEYANLVRIPAGNQEIIGKYKKLIGQFIATNNRQPTQSELEAILGSDAYILDRDAVFNSGYFSLSAPIPTQDLDGGPLVELVANKFSDDPIDNLMTWRIWQAIKELSPLERKVITLKICGYSIKEIAQILSYSQHHVSYTYRLVRKKLKEKLFPPLE